MSNDYLIQCPNCGSTAQTRQVGETVHSDKGGYYFEETYTCGCGCNFIAHFPRVVCDYTILRKGD